MVGTRGESWVKARTEGEVRISVFILFLGMGCSIFHVFFFICSALFLLEKNWCLKYTMGNRTRNAGVVQARMHRIACTGGS